jgi:inorganic pyrophosphatase
MRSSCCRRLADAPDFLLAEIANFFEMYKLIEPGKVSTVGEWADVEAAEAEIAAALQRYSATRSRPSSGSASPRVTLRR